MCMVWHVDKYKITFKLFINSRRISSRPAIIDVKSPVPGRDPAVEKNCSTLPRLGRLTLSKILCSIVCKYLLSTEGLHGTLSVGKHISGTSISGTSIFSVFLEIIHEFKIYEQQNKRAMSGLADTS